MALLIECQVTSQTALFGYDFKAAAQVTGLRDVKQSSVLAFPFVFFDNAERYVKKFDMALRLGLLPCDVNPFGTVFLCDDVVFRQVCQICLPMPVNTEKTNRSRVWHRR